MTEHTSGPWEHSFDYSIYSRGRPEGDLKIARVAMTVDASDLANARLIAAAPDLLAALEEMTTEYHAVREGQGWYYELESITKARAAIAKAKP